MALDFDMLNNVAKVMINRGILDSLRMRWNSSHLTSNQVVGGSSPSGRAIKIAEVVVRGVSPLV